MARRVTRREFIETAVATTALASGGGARPRAAADRPNVLFMFATISGTAI